MKVTVLMPVYNGEKYLREAIDSILNQSFKDFEFLIINDGSTDDSFDIITSYNDARIRLINNDYNLGLIQTLNKGLDLARGEYIARMDCDDVSLPHRLAKQVAFMDERPKTGISGGCMRLIGDDTEQIIRYPINHEEVRCRLLFDSPLAHPTVIMRRKTIIDNRLYYDPMYLCAEDYELWARASLCCNIENMDDVLVLYRRHDRQISSKYITVQFSSAMLVRRFQLKELGIDPSEEEMAIHQSICTGVNHMKGNYLYKIRKWFFKLINANNNNHIYFHLYLINYLAKAWFDMCNKCSRLTRWYYKIVWLMPYNHSLGIGFRQRLSFFMIYGLGLNPPWLSLSY